MSFFHRLIKPLTLADVFTPNTTARFTYIERKYIEEAFLKNIDINGRQIIIYGHSGSGKTTLTRRMLKRVGVKHIVNLIQRSMNCFCLLLTN